LTRSDLLESGWREGASVDREDFERFVSLRQYPRALNQAVAMLARRPCSKGEISQNLRRHRYADDVIGLVICKLEKENLLNDQEFSELWIQQRSRKYGSRRIRQELRTKGVPESTAEEALSSLSEEEMLESATVLAAKAWSKAKPGEDLRKTRQRIIASLVRKGFDWDLAKQASDTAESEVSF
ncbi:MAG: regulatory protein RecX, partial [Candidatus Limivicinus sp.]